MQALLLWATLLCGAPPIADGTLLFLENSNLFVELYTRSETTHVAIVLNDADQPWVYEATPHEVRKLRLADYYAELGRMNQRRSLTSKIRVTMAQPRAPYTAAQTTAMRGLVEEQLKRRYSIKGYVRGQSDGVHCAELAARTLCKANALDLPRCQDECPATLLAKITPLSRPLAVIAIEEPVERSTWCERTTNDWLGFTNWCQWSCWEAWTFCW